MSKPAGIKVRAKLPYTKQKKKRKEENITLKANYVTARIGACGYTKIIFFLYQERIDAVSLKFTNFMPSTSGVSSPA